jgi:hypothetical protein
MPDFGKLLIIVGGFIVVVGLFLTLGLRIPFLGKLPGDIVTSLLLSLVLTLVLNVFFRR